uniref:(northern house mosquito) hypothetical protein n=1 Tax=Culex pipiens TaxID=7175 RepID=A0A8D8NU86_CULPI
MAESIELSVAFAAFLAWARFGFTAPNSGSSVTSSGMVLNCSVSGRSGSNRSTSVSIPSSSSTRAFLNRSAFKITGRLPSTRISSLILGFMRVVLLCISSALLFSPNCRSIGVISFSAGEPSRSFVVGRWPIGNG